MSSDGSQALRRVADALTRLRLVWVVLVGTSGATYSRCGADGLHVTLLLVHARIVVASRLRSPLFRNFELALAAHEDVIFVFKEVLTKLIEVAQIWLVVLEVPLLRRTHNLLSKVLVTN